MNQQELPPQRFNPGQQVVCIQNGDNFREVTTGEVHKTPPPGVAIPGEVYTVEYYDHYNYQEKCWFITLIETAHYISHGECDFEPLVSDEQLAEDLEEVMNRNSQPVEQA